MCGEDASNAMPVKREINICLKPGWAEPPLSIHTDKIQGLSGYRVCLFRTTLLSMRRGLCGESSIGPGILVREMRSVNTESLFPDFFLKEL